METDRLINPVSTGVVERTRVNVRETGVRVYVGNSIYTKTNHYIKESRPYIRNSKHRQYWKCCNVNIILLFFFWLAVSMATSFLHWTAAAGNVVINTLWVYFFSQHMMVVCCTLPHVLRQPILPNSEMRGRAANEFIEIQVEQVRGTYLAMRNAGIGVVQREGGVIKFHVLSEGAAWSIRTSRKCSIIGFVCSLLLLIFTCFVTFFDVFYFDYGALANHKLF